MEESFNEEEFIKYLKIPLYKLYYSQDASNKEFQTKRLKEKYENDYSADERGKINLALEWAIKNPTYDFRNLLPGLKQTNQEIINYFRTLYSAIS